MQANISYIIGLSLRGPLDSGVIHKEGCLTKMTLFFMIYLSGTDTFEFFDKLWYNYEMMTKIIQMLKSRTFWTIVLLVVFNGVSSVKNLVPVAYQPTVDIILGLVATIFHINPSQKY